MDHSIERALEMKRLRMEIKQCPADSPERERRWATHRRAARQAPRGQGRPPRELRVR
jgi:hypothetical protein